MSYSYLQTPEQRTQFSMNQNVNNSMMQKNLMNQQSNMEEARYYDMGKRAEHNVATEFFNNSANPISTNQIPY